MWNVFQIAVMAITFLYVFNKTHFFENRIVAFVPLGMLLLDCTSLSAQFASIPALFVVMEAARLVVIAACVAAVRRDARMLAARNRERAKAKFQARTAAMQRVNNVYEMPLYA